MKKSSKIEKSTYSNLHCTPLPPSSYHLPFVSSRVTILPSIQPHQTKELIPRLLPLLNTPQDTTRNSRRTRLLHAAHHHTKMTRLHNNGDTLRFEDFHDGVCDVLGEAFLDLEAPGEHVCYAGELGDSDDGGVGDVAYVHL